MLLTANRSSMNYSVVVAPPQVPVTWENLTQAGTRLKSRLGDDASNTPQTVESGQKNTSLFGCNFCNGYFSRDSYLREHITRCQFQRPNMPSTFCGVCKELFFGVEMLQTHLQSHFKVGEVNNTTQLPQPVMRRKSPLRPMRQLITKAKFSVNNQPFECRFCGRTFQKGSAMKMHIDKVHVTNIKKEFKCRFCNQQYTTRHLLQNHEDSHDGKWKHTCQVCGKGFNSSGALVIHERIHTSNKPYKCDECEKCFVASNELRKHQRIHTGERPYKCAQCNSSFTQAANLRRHQLKNCRGKPSAKMLMKRKKCKRNAKLEERLDNAEPTASLQISEPEVVTPDKLMEPPVALNLLNIQPSDTLTQINTDLGEFQSDLSADQLIEGLGDDTGFNAFSESKPALGLEGMDTKPIQLLGLDDLENNLGNDALGLMNEDVSDDHQGDSVLPLDGTFDISAFSPFKKLASETIEKGQLDSIVNVLDEATLMNYLKLEIPFLMQNGLGNDAETVQNGCSPSVNNKMDKIDSPGEQPKVLKPVVVVQDSKDSSASLPPKFKPRGNLLHRGKPASRGKPLQQRRHTGVNPVKKNIKKAVKMSIKKSPRRIIRQIKKEPTSVGTDDHYRGLLDSVDTAKRTVNGTDIYPCTNCDRTFTELGHVRLHMVKTHQIQQTKKFACKYCNKQYSDRNTLKGHENQHNGHNKFTCNICHKVFNLKSGLVIHERVHSGHRPFSCESCDKTFRSSNELARHRRTHTGARPYKCHYCTMTFTQSANLSRHMHKSCKVKRGNLVIDVQPLHSCDICGASFNDKNKLDQHATSCRDTSTPESVSSQTSHQVADEVSGNNRSDSHISETLEFPDIGTIDLPKPKKYSNNLKSTFLSSPVKKEKDQVSVSSFHKNLSPRKSTLVDEFEVSMKNKLQALTTSIKNKNEGFSSGPIINGLTTENPKSQINGFPVESHKKCDFLSTDDSTIGYEYGMSVPKVTMETKNKAKSKDDSAIMNSSFAHPKSNGFAAGQRLLTLTSLLTGNGLLAGNGISTLPVSTLGASGEVKTVPPAVNKDSNSPNKQGAKATQAGRVQWNSLRERSRKYKLARKIKKPTPEPADLGDNMRIEGVGPDQVHVCNKCERRFKKRNHVKQHLIQHHKLHLGDKNYECNFCGKQYSDWITLKGHEKQHMGQYYQCKLCSKPFYTKGTLKVHEKTHSSERPYKCKECDKSFKTSRDMTRHTRKHTGVKPYKCTRCGKTFSQSGNLKRHVTNNKCKQQTEVNVTKLRVSPALKSATSAAGSRIRRKTYSQAARYRKNNMAQKRQNKTTLPQKDSQPPTNAVDLSDSQPNDVAAENGEKFTGVLLPVEPQQNIVRELQPDTSKTAAPSQDKLSPPPTEGVRSHRGLLIRELLQEESIFKKINRSMNNSVKLENTSPTLSALNIEMNVTRKSAGNLELTNEKPRNESRNTIGLLDIDDSKKFRCMKCDVTVTSRTALTFHYNAKHLNKNNSPVSTEKINNIIMTSVSARMLPCVLCKETFRTKTMLQDHEMTFHAQQTCRDCGEKLNGKNALDQHMVQHNLGLPRFKCEFCCRSYVFKGSLTKHMKLCPEFLKKTPPVTAPVTAPNITLPCISAQSVVTELAKITSPPKSAEVMNSPTKLTNVINSAPKVIQPREDTPKVVASESVAIKTKETVVTSCENEAEDSVDSSGENNVVEPVDVETDCVSTSEDIDEVECPKVNNVMSCFEEVLQSADVLEYMMPVFENEENISCETLELEAQNFPQLPSVVDKFDSTDPENENDFDAYGLELESLKSTVDFNEKGAVRQCTGDGQGQTDSSSAEMFTDSSAPINVEFSTAPIKEETAEGDTDDGLEDVKTEELFTLRFSCRLCSEDFSRPDKLALHVCWNHQPQVVLDALAQIECSLYGFNLRKYLEKKMEPETTDSETENEDEQNGAIDRILITSVTGGFTGDPEAQDAHNPNKHVKVIEPKEMVQVTSSSGEFYVEKSRVSLLERYGEHVELLPRGDSVRYKCKFCGKLFQGAGAQGELSGQERIRLHVIAHINRLTERRKGPAILNRRRSRVVHEPKKLRPQPTSKRTPTPPPLGVMPEEPRTSNSEAPEPFNVTPAETALSNPEVPQCSNIAPTETVLSDQVQPASKGNPVLVEPVNITPVEDTPPFRTHFLPVTASMRLIPAPPVVPDQAPVALIPAHPVMFAPNVVPQNSAIRPLGPRSARIALVPAQPMVVAQQQVSLSVTQNVTSAQNGAVTNNNATSESTKQSGKPKRKPSRMYRQYVEKCYNSAVRCKLCSNTYLKDDKRVIQQHMQTVHNTTGSSLPSLWQCRFCPKRFPQGSISAMEAHLVSDHSHQLDPKSPLLRGTTKRSRPLSNSQSENRERTKRRKTATTPSKVTGSEVGNDNSFSPQPQVTPSTDQNQNEQQTTGLYGAQAVKCKFCSETFVEASLDDLQYHLLAEHADVIDPTTMAQVKTIESSVLSPGVEAQSTSELNDLNKQHDRDPGKKIVEGPSENTANAFVPLSVSKEKMGPASVVPQPHPVVPIVIKPPLTVSLGPGSISIAPKPVSAPAAQNVTITQIVPEPEPMQELQPQQQQQQQHIYEIGPDLMDALVSRLQDYAPFVDIVSDRFGPGYKCRLCGKNYSSTALSPIRRHLVQYHVPLGHTLQGCEIPVPAAKNDSRDNRTDASTTKKTASTPAQKRTLLQQNWSDYSKHIALTLNEGVHQLCCKYCFKPYTRDNCKQLIEHLRQNHLEAQPVTPQAQLSVQQSVQQSSAQECPQHGQLQTQPVTKSEVAHERLTAQVECPQHGATVVDEEFIMKCSQVVVVGGAKMIKCCYCSVVYLEDNLEQLKEHLFRHYTEAGNMYPNEISSPMPSLKRKLAQQLGQFENVDLLRCCEVVAIEKTLMYKCRYCNAIFDPAQLDVVRAHLYSHYVSRNGYPAQRSNTTPLLMGNGEVATNDSKARN